MFKLSFIDRKPLTPDQAALRIQCFIRARTAQDSFACMKAFRKELDQAALVIQNAARTHASHLASTRKRLERDSSTLIQCAARSRAARLKSAFKRQRSAAATLLQSILRGSCARNKFLRELCKSPVPPPDLSWVHKALLREFHSAATAISAITRGFLARRRLPLRRLWTSPAIEIQSCLKSVLDRQKWNSKRLAHKATMLTDEEGCADQANVARTVLVAGLKGLHTRSRTKIESERQLVEAQRRQDRTKNLNVMASRLQAMVRGHLQRASLSQADSSAIRVQTWYRQRNATLRVERTRNQRAQNLQDSTRTAAEHCESSSSSTEECMLRSARVCEGAASVLDATWALREHWSQKYPGLFGQEPQLACQARQLTQSLEATFMRPSSEFANQYQELAATARRGSQLIRCVLNAGMSQSERSTPDFTRSRASTIDNLESGSHSSGSENAPSPTSACSYRSMSGGFGMLGAIPEEESSRKSSSAHSVPRLQLPKDELDDW